MKTLPRAVTVALVTGLVSVGCTGILGSFEVSGGASSGALDDGGTLPDGATPGTDGSTTTDGGGDGTTPLVCNAPAVKCPVENVCAVLASDPEHCGKCGRSCGGGTCDNGTCKPVKLFETATLAVGAIDVAGNDLYFTTSDGNIENKLLTCPNSGCKAAPKQLAVMQYSIEAIAAMHNQTVAFLSAPTQSTQRPAIFACTPAGCPSPPVSFTGDGLNGIDPRLRINQARVFFNRGGSGLGFSSCPTTTPGTCTAATIIGDGTAATGTRGTRSHGVDATNIYFVDNGSRGSVIATCPQATACTPTTLVPGDQSDVDGIEVEGGKLFWIKPGRDGFNEGRLFTCDLPGCASPKFIANGLLTTPNQPRELRVDATGAYWINTNSKIQRCAPNGCLGGAQDVTGALVSPHALVTTPNFIYWAEKSSIWRLAK